MEEIWKEVKDYEGLYEVSNLGRVKSLKWGKERILKPGNGSASYLVVVLSKNSKTKTKTVHKLVAIAFLNHFPDINKLVVDHIDNNPLNNRVDNLQLITQRENLSKDGKTEFTGVQKKGNKFQSKIKVNGKSIYLGVFSTPKEASLYYQNAVISIENNTEIVTAKIIKLSKYKGVYWHKYHNKWVSIYKRKYLGSFHTEEEAHQRVQLEIHTASLQD